MAKLQARGYELLDPSQYVLEVIEAEAVNEYGPQLRLKLRVTEGEHKGFEFTDYPNRGAEDSVKVGTKAWDIFQACLNQQLAPDEELDTDDLIGKRFEAMVSVKKLARATAPSTGPSDPTDPRGHSSRKCPRPKSPTT